MTDKEKWEESKGKSIGYSVTLQMDYGSGRQATIVGTLPLGATLEDFNAELDKLRKATNRQLALVLKREIENTVMMSEKTLASLRVIIAAYEDELNKEMQRIDQSNTKNHTLVKQQKENMRQQALNYKLTKNEEIMREQANVDKGKLMLARLHKEIEEG